jgi:hypothetical protein
MCTIHEIQDGYCKNAEPISISALAVVGIYRRINIILIVTLGVG